MEKVIFNPRRVKETKEYTIGKYAEQIIFDEIEKISYVKFSDQSTLFDMVEYQDEQFLIPSRLVEVKVRYPFYFTNESIETYAFANDLIQAYLDTEVKFNLPLELYIVDYRTGQIISQKLRLLVEPTNINGQIYPRSLKRRNSDKEFSVFPTKMFEHVRSLYQEEIQKFIELSE